MASLCNICEYLCYILLVRPKVTLQISASENEEKSRMAQCTGRRGHYSRVKVEDN